MPQTCIHQTCGITRRAGLLHGSGARSALWDALTMRRFGHELQRSVAACLNSGLTYMGTV
jgi:hypothetical protein